MINQADHREHPWLKKVKTNSEYISRLSLKSFYGNFFPAIPSEDIYDHYRAYTDSYKLVALTSQKDRDLVSIITVLS